MMNFWKQRNPNNITEKPPHYRSKSDGGAVLLYLDFLTVLEGEADIVSAVSRSTPTQSQRNRIFFETVKGILSALPFFHIWTPTCLCAIQRFHRVACAGTVQIWRVWDFPTSILQRKMVFVYTKTLLAGLLVIYPSALTTTKRFIFLTPFKLCIFV